MNANAEIYGLNINISKTKFMRIRRQTGFQDPGSELPLMGGIVTRKSESEYFWG